MRSRVQDVSKMAAPRQRTCFSRRKALELAINEGSDLESDEDSADEIYLFSGEEFIPAKRSFWR